MLLLAGALLNLAGGARRPLRERALVRQDHHAAIQRAAEAVRRHVPESERLTLVGYDGDFLGALDCAVWADYRLRWLLYPRRFETLRLHGSGPVPSRPGYRLYFRVTRPPELPDNAGVVLEKAPMFVLTGENR